MQRPSLDWKTEGEREIAPGVSLQRPLSSGGHPPTAKSRCSAAWGTVHEDFLYNEKKKTNDAVVSWWALHFGFSLSNVNSKWFWKDHTVFWCWGRILGTFCKPKFGNFDGNGPPPPGERCETKWRIFTKIHPNVRLGPWNWTKFSVRVRLAGSNLPMWP